MAEAEKVGIVFLVLSLFLLLVMPYRDKSLSEMTVALMSGGCFLIGAFLFVLGGAK